MKEFAAQDLRNVAVVGHGDCGKTSLVSAMLFDSGMMNRLGKVTSGTTVTDYEQDEIDRQISISAALAHLEWDKRKLNLIDTPGYGAFIGEAKLSLRVTEGALVNICGVAGVEVQTEKVWAFCEEFQLPRILVVNKLDRERASFKRAISSIQERFGRTAIPLQIPVGEEKDFRGVVDLLEMKAFLYEPDESGKMTVGDLPAELAVEAKSLREKLIEMVAESDDALMEIFFDKGELTNKEISEGIRKAVLKRKLFPILAASAGMNIGVRQVMDAVVRFLPSPLERGEITGKDPKEDGQILNRKPVIDEPYSAFVFKTVADPFAGRITFFRVFSGSIHADSGVYNVTRSTNEKFGSIH
ncbi:MAG: GTP-binding protein, partial [Acidobacteria bacterium]|nr:GTP-binding protein [Acidobacteriota bacterium]